MDIKLQAWLNELIEDGDLSPFYWTKAWRRIRRAVLKMDRHECQECKRRGKYTRATLVHHINELKDRPALALTIEYEGKRNLESLCNPCHERTHNHRQEVKPPLTEEWW